MGDMPLATVCAKQGPGITTALAVAAVLLAGCGGSKRAAGTEGGPCYGNATCNAGLTCLSELCVVAPGANPNGPSAPSAVPAKRGLPVTTAVILDDYEGAAVLGCSKAGKLLSSAWVNLLQTDGLVNRVLEFLHLGDGSRNWLDGDWPTVVMGLIYGYIPFFILPLYAALERLDFRLIEASRDLGASSFWTFVKVTLPLSIPGLMAASVIVVLMSVW